MPDEQTVTTKTFIECDGCGVREEVEPEEARSKARQHAEHCRRAHKGRPR